MQFSDLREFDNDCSIILQGTGANVKLKGRNTYKITLKWRYVRGQSCMGRRLKGLGAKPTTKGKVRD